MDNLWNSDHASAELTALTRAEIGVLTAGPSGNYRNWKRLGGYKDTDHHIKFRMSDIQRHLQQKAKEGRP